MTRVPVVRNRSPWYEPFDLMNRFFSRWSPVQRQDKDEDDFFAPFFRDFPFDFGGSPAVDVEETDQEIVVRAEMPGMEKDEFSIELEENTLILRGEKKHKDEHKDRNVHRVECRYGRFDRRIDLPATIQSDKAVAEYKNGVLNIVLPKAETAKRKAITVNVK
ncbi:MAG: Hsp20/alpha crystallin family protein [Candidatus Hinthialibacter sp.]